MVLADGDLLVGRLLLVHLGEGGRVEEGLIPGSLCRALTWKRDGVRGGEGTQSATPPHLSRRLGRLGRLVARHLDLRPEENWLLLMNIPNLFTWLWDLGRPGWQRKIA